LIEITDQRRIGLIEGGQRLADVVGDLLVHVPAAIGECDKPDARLDEPPRDEAFLPERMAAVEVS